MTIFYNRSHMRFATFALFLALCSLAPSPMCAQSNPSPGKRPMTYADTDNWRAISAQKLSADGKFVGYGLFPQDGNGEVVLRKLADGTEIREAAGMRPPPPPPDPEREGPPAQRTVNLQFSSDSQWAAFSTFPEKGSKKKDGLVIVDLMRGAKRRIDDVKSFQMPAEAPGLIAYLLDNKEKQLVIEKLGAVGKQTIAEVAEFSVAKDGQTIVYATGGGVYAFSPANWDAPAAALIEEKGKFAKLAWDDKQSQVAFLNEKSLYVWERKPGAARAIASGFVPTDKANLVFSKDGARLFFSVAAQKPAAQKEEAGYDLWHWKDDVVQTIQRSRAAAERNRSYRAVVTLADGRARQLGDATLGDVSASETGLYAIGSDDRAYRSMVEYDTRYSDQYLVNTATGERKLLGKQRAGGYSWSPDGRYAMRFDAKDWHCLNVATGVEVNLTQGIGVNFFNEDYDSPGRPNSYAPPSWTRDGKWILLADRYDVWQVSPDGRVAKNLSDGVGRKQNLQFRVVRADAEDRSEGVDQAKPLLLRAENLSTRVSGFYADVVDGATEPREIVSGPKNYSAPIKAKNADVYLVTAGNFREYPDLLVTNGEMKSFQKISDANPQMAGFNWGTAELMPFRSHDGLALQAGLYKPEGFDPKKKYPLMVYIYERLSQNVNNFAEPRPTNSINIPIYVSNGYIVLTPDIAYKIGYPGDSAMNCVMPAIQKLVEQGYIDESRIGIQGHSWGGYQIAYMVTRTKLFKAAAPGAVVANMFSAYNGIRYGPGLPRQFQYERTQSRIGGTPWTYPLRFLENSPLFRADQITTPLLMIHNDADDAVPYTQGIEMFLALRRLGKEAYMFTYNGEPHNLRIRANQRHYSAKLKEFFDYHLMGAPKPAWMEKGRSFLEKEPTPRGRQSAPTDEAERP